MLATQMCCVQVHSLSPFCFSCKTLEKPDAALYIVRLYCNLCPQLKGNRKKFNHHNTNTHFHVQGFGAFSRSTTWHLQLSGCQTDPISSMNLLLPLEALVWYSLHAGIWAATSFHFSWAPVSLRPTPTFKSCEELLFGGMAVFFLVQDSHTLVFRGWLCFHVFLLLIFFHIENR